MAVNYNSAYRLHTVLTEFAEQPAGTSALAAWSAVFGLRSDDKHHVWIQATAKLSLIFDEVDLLEVKMEGTTFPPET